MSKNEDKKTAIKLINKYAESYKYLEEENNSLKAEIKDLRANLKINKEIIEGFFNSGKKSDKNKMYISKLKEENTHLQQQMDKILSEKEELRTKLTYVEQATAEALNREREENEKYKNKLFVMDNALIKKDNIIVGLKKKIDRVIDEDKIYFEKEIHVIEPTAAITQMHDELLLYKQIYDNLSVYIRENKDSIMKYETIVGDLQNENGKLRTQIKLQVLTANKEKENYIKTIRDNEFKGTKRSAKLDAPELPKKYSMASQNYDMKLLVPNIDSEKLKNKFKVDQLTNYNTSLIKQNNKMPSENDEWLEILRYSGLTPEELDRLGKNKMFTRIVEAIEMLSRLLCDKNLQIRLIEQENENLNQKNVNLNKENISLFQQNIELKKELQKSVNNKSRKSTATDLSESSMINNTSRITINNLNINSMNSANLKKDKINDNVIVKEDKRNFGNETNNPQLVENIKRYDTNKTSQQNSHKYEIDNYNNENNEDDEIDTNLNDHNNTVEYVKKKEHSSSNPKSEESSGHDSIVYTKNLNNKNNNKINKDTEHVEKLKSNLNNKKTKEILNTLESCTSGEFMAGLMGEYEESFISHGNNDFNNLNIDIK